MVQEGWIVQILNTVTMMLDRLSGKYTVDTITVRQDILRCVDSETGQAELYRYWTILTQYD